MSDPSETGGYPQSGEIIDEKYRVERLLGVGGMGAVVEATHLLRRAPVALKFMSARLVHDPAVVERFLNEGVAASRINNEHVVSVLDVSKLASGQPYLVMEYLQGRDLAKLLSLEGTPGLGDVQRCVHFVLQVLRGLQVAHAAGIIHRDLKPANCLVVERDGEPDFLKIVDFGISKLESDPLNLTTVGSALGTPLYVSPEQARDPASVDARGDLYSVATILYELLAGRTPFHPASGQLSELFVALATKAPPTLEVVRADLPEGLDAAIRVGLAKSPDARYRSAAEMAGALAPFADARSERVLRQLLQRSTLRPHGSAPPLEPPGRGSVGVSSLGDPTERAGGSPARTPGRSPLPAPYAKAEPLVARSLSGLAGASWAGHGASDTAAPTSLPTFLQRRQTEIKIAIPVLVALLLAAVLFQTQRSSSPPAASPPAATAAPGVEPAGAVSAPAATAIPPVPGALPVVSPPTIRVVPSPTPAPGSSALDSARTPHPSVAEDTGEAERPSVRPLPQSHPAANASAAPAGAGRRRRPSLKQIGISE